MQQSNQNYDWTVFQHFMGRVVVRSWNRWKNMFNRRNEASKVSCQRPQALRGVQGHSPFMTKKYFKLLCIHQQEFFRNSQQFFPAAGFYLHPCMGQHSGNDKCLSNVRHPSLPQEPCILQFHKRNKSFDHIQIPWKGQSLQNAIKEPIRIINQCLQTN